MTKIYVDDKEIEVKEGQNLLHATLSHGFDVPYFCWHPSLGSVGACRQCAVIQYKDAEDKKGRLVMSCMTPVTEGARISIDCDEAKSFRASVIEWLMTNHPHDCPVCDEGGECHLQDMTVMSGHNYRRYRFKKRTFNNQNLGPLVNHEMNRCITCYRCVRYYRDVAGGTDLNAFSSSQNVFFGRVEDGMLESEFSGNLAEICPTGVFTDKSFKQNYTRKWDLQVAPSVCQMCSLGCNITPGERNGTLRRVQNRFHSEINGYFLCDRGRYGHDFVNGSTRIYTPLFRATKGEPQKEIALAEALNIAKQKIASARSIVGVGSPRASLESNFALRNLVGSENFYSSESEKTFDCMQNIYSKMSQGIVNSLSLKEIEESDAVVIFGEDLTNTAPMMAFSVRQVVFRLAQKSAEQMKIPSWNDAAIRNLLREKKGPIYNFQASRTKLDEISALSLHISPKRMEQIAFAIAHELSEKAPVSKSISEEDANIARELALVLKNAKNPVIIAGATLESTALIDGATNIALALNDSNRKCGLAFVPKEANSLGLHVLKPGSSKKLVRKLSENPVSVLVSLENDSQFEKAEFVLVLDYLNHKALARADLVLPVTSFAEGTGSLVNNEGRAQRYYPPISNQRPTRDAWKFLNKLAQNNDSDAELISLDELTEQLGKEVLELSSFCGQIQKASFRICGQKIPRAPTEQSGRTALNTQLSMHEQAPKQDLDSPYAYSMEGAKSGVSSAQTAVFWSPQWNSVQSLNKFQEEIGGPLKGGPVGVHLFAYREGKSEFFPVTEGDYDLFDSFNVVWLSQFYRSKLALHSSTLMQCPSMSNILISDMDAQVRNMKDGDLLEIKLKSGVISLPCAIQKEVPRGWLLVPEELG